MSVRGLFLGTEFQSRIWQSFESSSSDTQTTQEELIFSLHGSPDRRGLFHLDVEASVSYQPSAPAQAPFRPGRAAYIDLRQAEFGIGARKGLQLRVGRLSMEGLLMEPTDGVELGYRGLAKHTNLAIRAGFRADPINYAPRFDQPILALESEGRILKRGLRVGWGISGAYLPGLGQGLYDGAVAGARLSLGFEKVNTYGDAALFAPVLQTSASPTAGTLSPMLEHATLGGDYDAGEIGRFGGSLRMMGRLLWPTERLLMPSAYLAAGSRYSAELNYNRKPWSSFSYAPSAEIGLVAANDGLNPVAWGRLSLSKFRIGKLIERVQFGYRAEFGWNSAQLLQGSLTFRRAGAFRLWIYQEGGVRILVPSQQILPTGATRLELLMELPSSLSLSAELLALYGFTGTGLRASVGLRFTPPLK